MLNVKIEYYEGNKANIYDVLSNNVEYSYHIHRSIPAVPREGEWLYLPDGLHQSLPRYGRVFGVIHDMYATRVLLEGFN
jgi:hypothetical protein